MTTLYRLKPLEWEETKSGEGRQIFIAGDYSVWQQRDGSFACNLSLMTSRLCDSIEHGKQISEEHWQTKHHIHESLEEVTDEWLDQPTEVGEWWNLQEDSVHPELVAVEERRSGRLIANGPRIYQWCDTLPGKWCRAIVPKCPKF